MALAAREVEAGYGRVRVLRGVTCAFEAGRVTAVVGPNGAGKSTLLRVLMGGLSASAGEVTLGGRAVGSLGRVERARAMALVPQSSVSGASFSVLQTVRLGRLAWGESAVETTRVARAALARVGLEDRAEEPLGVLSAGQQQRALLARAMAQLWVPDGVAGAGASERASGVGARYLLADEPVASMDPKHALGSLGLLREAAGRGVGVVVVLHDVGLASEWGDDAVLLDAGGRVASTGPACEVLRPEVLGPVFETGFVMATGGPGHRAFPHPIARA